MRRATYLLLALAFIAALTLGIPHVAQRSEGKPVLRIGVLKGGTRPLVEGAGVLGGAPYQVQWVEFASGQPLLDALATGAIDLGTSGDTALQYAYQAGRPLVVVMAERAEDVPGASGILVPPGSAILSAHDLKGRIIGTTRGSAGHFLTLRALAAAGLRAKDVCFAFLTPADAKAAFQSGSIDAWATWPPYIGTALTDGSGRIAVDGNGLVRNYLFQVTSSEISAAKKPPLRDFVARLESARRWADANPSAAAAALARDSGLPLAVARYTLSKQHWHPVPLDGDLITYQRRLAKTLAEADVLAVHRDVATGFHPI